MLRAIQTLGIPFLGCLTMIGILGYVGLHVLKREVIFIDIALAQIAAVGAILAHLVWGAHGDSFVAYACAFGGTLVAAVFYSLVRSRVVQIPLEAVIGVSYAIAAGGALFLIGIAPGHVHVHRMLAGSILFTKWSHVVFSAAVFAVVGFFFWLLRKPFRQISDDYESAAQAGVKVAWWDFAFYALVGVAITQALRIGGVLVVFSLLIIPATISAVFSSGWGRRIGLVWAFGAVCSAVGLLFAYYLDFSVGPCVAMWLGVALVLAGLSACAPRVGVAATVVLALGFATLLCTMEPLGASDTPASHAASPATPAPTTDGDQSQEIGLPAEEPGIEDVAQAGSLAELRHLFRSISDPRDRSEVVLRALKLDARMGARMALEFLKSDPPFFFRQTVGDALADAMGEPPGFNVTEPFASAVNRQAAAKVTAKFSLGSGPEEGR